MDRVNAPRGYTLGKGQSARDILEVQAELLRSEGIDPKWPGFDEDPDRHKKDRR